MKKTYFLSIILMFTFRCTNSDSDRIITLIDSNLNVGMHSFLWDQHDNDGDFVGTGKYSAKIASGSFTSSAEFSISSSAESVPVPPDSSAIKFATSNSLQTNSDTYAIGDTICIYFPIAEASHTELWIEK